MHYRHNFLWHAHIRLKASHRFQVVASIAPRSTGSNYLSLVTANVRARRPSKSISKILLFGASIDHRFAAGIVYYFIADLTPLHHAASEL
jgi:hypothetical protein